MTVPPGFWVGFGMGYLSVPLTIGGAWVVYSLVSGLRRRSNVYRAIREATRPGRPTTPRSARG